MQLKDFTAGATAAAWIGLSALAWAQGTPAAQPATPAPAAAAPAAPGAATPGAAAPGAATPADAAPVPSPAPEAYSYDPAGRRDPFISLVARGTEPVQNGKKATGLGGLATVEVVLRGVLESRGAYVALVSGPDGKTYTAHANDRLLDGIIRSVTPQGLVIMQEVNDPLSLVKQREVRKGLRAVEDAQ
jgi:hypothetical protein